RTLLVSGDGVRVRQQKFVPASGAFSRTLTLVTNPGTTPVTVQLDSRLALKAYDWTILATSDGDTDFGSLDGYAIARHGPGTEDDTAIVLGGIVAAQSRYFFPGHPYGDVSGSGFVAATHAVTAQAGQTRGFP